MKHKYSNLKHVVERNIGALRGSTDKAVQTAIAELEQELANPSEGDLAEEGDHKKSGAVPEPEEEKTDEDTVETTDDVDDTAEGDKPKKGKVALKKKK